MTDLEKADKDNIADQKLQNALRLAEPYDGPWIDYERTYTIGAVVQELKVREEALRVLAAAYREQKERADKAEAALKLIKPVITCYTESSEDIWDDLLADIPSPGLEGEWPS